MAGWHLDTSPVMNIAMELFTVAMVLMVCRSWMITDDHDLIVVGSIDMSPSDQRRSLHFGGLSCLGPWGPGTAGALP